MARATKLQASPPDTCSENDVLAHSEGWVLGPMTSQVHPSTCPVAASWIPTSLNQLKLKLNTADSKFVNNNLGKHLII